MTQEELADQKYVNERDSKVNASTSLPLGETIKVPAIWVIEAFTPALINNLKRGAEKLGWFDEVSINPDFLDKVGSMRTSLGNSGWLNLGYIVPLDRKAGIFHNRRAPLPSGISAVHASISQPFPSTTLLCCQFLLDNNLARSLEQPLAETFETYKEPIGDTTLRIIGVDTQKQQAVEVMRAYLHSLCTEWMTEYFPGYFSSELGNHLIPSCELLLFSKEENFLDRKRSILEPDYLQMLDLHQIHYFWECKQLPNLFLSLTERRHQTTSGRMTLFGNTDRILSGIDLKAYGDTKEEQIIHRLEDLDDTLGTWILGLMAEDYVAEMGKTRDAYGSLDLTSNALGTEAIRSLDRRLLEFQRSALPFSCDIAAYTNDSGLFADNIYEFQSVQKWTGYEINLFANIRTKISTAAIHIRETERQIQLIAAQTGNIITALSNERVAGSNLRLQDRMFWMTLLMLFLTVLMAKKELSDLWAWFLN